MCLEVASMRPRTKRIMTTLCKSRFLYGNMWNDGCFSMFFLRPVGRRPIGLQPTSPEATKKLLFLLGLHGFHWICLTRTLWLRFSFWTVEETEEPEVSAETAGLYFKRLEYFNFGSVLHNVLIFNISRTSGAPVRWLFSPGLMIFRFPRELTRGDLVKCLKVGQCSDSVELLTSTSSTSTYISQMFHTYISHLFFLGSLLTNLEEVSRWICWFLHFCTWFTFPPGGTACGTPGCQPL